MNRLRALIGELRTPQFGLVLTAALALAGAPLAAQSGGGFDLTWNRAGGGPAAPAAGGGYELRATAAQPTAGNLDDGDGRVLVDGYGAIYAVHAFTLRLSLGWNLISVPFQPLNPAWREVLPGTVRGPLWQWGETGYEPVLRLSPKCGYWVWSRADAERVVQGVAVEDPYLDLPAGWHLVGPVGLPPYPALALPLEVTPAGAEFGLPYQWEPTLGTTWPTTTGLTAGLASWVALREPARLRLGP